MATHEEGMRAARAVAQWELGDPYWADLIVGAYLSPDTAMKKLREEMGDD
jgi:hypothetical protein